MNQSPIPTFIINLEKRADRKKHVLAEFQGRSEFKVNLITPIFNKIGAVSLWKTMTHILSDLSDKNDDFVLICEDDHQFTPDYSKELLDKCIQVALESDIDVLSGGVHWFNSSLQISENIFWVDRFTGTQFILVFKRFFEAMINADFSNSDAADRRIADLANSIFLVGPFISVQKDFGYSDATPKNSIKGEMKKLFGKSIASIAMIKEVTSVYKTRGVSSHAKGSFGNISIPTYVITSNKENQVAAEFFGRKEFDLTFVDFLKDENGKVDSWLAVRNIVKAAIANDDDVLIICDDEHKFTEHYRKDDFIKNVIDAYTQECEILVGSVHSFGLAVAISHERAWVNHFDGVQFIVLYRSVFRKILMEKVVDGQKINDVLSDITSNKMVFFPFISKMRVPGPTELAKRNSDGELIISLLEQADTKLERIYAASNRYKLLNNF